MANEMNDLKRLLLMILFAIPMIASTNIDCRGKAFHCVNSTHFMICVDLGGGISTTIDDFVIPCPPTTMCHESNIFECEFSKPEEFASQYQVNDVIKHSDTSDMISVNNSEIVSSSTSLSVTDNVILTTVTSAPKLEIQRSFNQSTGFIYERNTEDVINVQVSTGFNKQNFNENEILPSAIDINNNPINNADIGSLTDKSKFIGEGTSVSEPFKLIFNESQSKPAINLSSDNNATTVAHTKSHITKNVSKSENISADLSKLKETYLTDEMGTTPMAITISQKINKVETINQKSYINENDPFIQFLAEPLSTVESITTEILPENTKKYFVLENKDIFSMPLIAVESQRATKTSIPLPIEDNITSRPTEETTLIVEDKFKVPHSLKPILVTAEVMESTDNTKLMMPTKNIAVNTTNMNTLNLAQHSSTTNMLISTATEPTSTSNDIFKTESFENGLYMANNMEDGNIKFSTTSEPLYEDKAKTNVTSDIFINTYSTLSPYTAIMNFSTETTDEDLPSNFLNLTTNKNLIINEEGNNRSESNQQEFVIESDKLPAEVNFVTSTEKYIGKSTIPSRDFENIVTTSYPQYVNERISSVSTLQESEPSNAVNSNGKYNSTDIPTTVMSYGEISKIVSQSEFSDHATEFYTIMPDSAQTTLNMNDIDGQKESNNILELVGLNSTSMTEYIIENNTSILDGTLNTIQTKKSLKNENSEKNYIKLEHLSTTAPTETETVSEIFPSTQTLNEYTTTYDFNIDKSQSNWKDSTKRKTSEDSKVVNNILINNTAAFNTNDDEITKSSALTYLTSGIAQQSVMNNLHLNMTKNSTINSVLSYDDIKTPAPNQEFVDITSTDPIEIHNITDPQTKEYLSNKKLINEISSTQLLSFKEMHLENVKQVINSQPPLPKNVEYGYTTPFETTSDLVTNERISNVIYEDDIVTNHINNLPIIKGYTNAPKATIDFVTTEKINDIIFSKDGIRNDSNKSSNVKLLPFTEKDVGNNLFASASDSAVLFADSQKKPSDENYAEKSYEVLPLPSTVQSGYTNPQKTTVDFGTTERISEIIYSKENIVTEHMNEVITTPLPIIKGYTNPPETRIDHVTIEKINDLIVSRDGILNDSNKSLNAEPLSFTEKGKGNNLGDSVSDSAVLFHDSKKMSIFEKSPEKIYEVLALPSTVESGYTNPQKTTVDLVTTESISEVIYSKEKNATEQMNEVITTQMPLPIIKGYTNPPKTTIDLATIEKINDLIVSRDGIPNDSNKLSNVEPHPFTKKGEVNNLGDSVYDSAVLFHDSKKMSIFEKSPEKIYEVLALPSTVESGYTNPQKTTVDLVTTESISEVIYSKEKNATEHMNEVITTQMPLPIIKGYTNPPKTTIDLATIEKINDLIVSRDGIPNDSNKLSNVEPHPFTKKGEVNNLSDSVYDSAALFHDSKKMSIFEKSPEKIYEVLALPSTVESGYTNPQKTTVDLVTTESISEVIYSKEKNATEHMNEVITTQIPLPIIKGYTNSPKTTIDLVTIEKINTVESSYTNPQKSTTDLVTTEKIIDLISVKDDFLNEYNNFPTIEPVHLTASDKENNYNDNVPGNGVLSGGLIKILGYTKNVNEQMTSKFTYTNPSPTFDLVTADITNDIIFSQKDVSAGYTKQPNLEPDIVTESDKGNNFNDNMPGMAVLSVSIKKSPNTKVEHVKEEINTQVPLQSTPEYAYTNSPIILVTEGMSTEYSNLVEPAVSTGISKVNDRISSVPGRPVLSDSLQPRTTHEASSENINTSAPFSITLEQGNTNTPSTTSNFVTTEKINKLIVTEPDTMVETIKATEDKNIGSRDLFLSAVMFVYETNNDSNKSVKSKKSITDHENIFDNNTEVKNINNNNKEKLNLKFESDLTQRVSDINIDKYDINKRNYSSFKEKSAHKTLPVKPDTEFGNKTVYTTFVAQADHVEGKSIDPLWKTGNGIFFIRTGPETFNNFSKKAEYLNANFYSLLNNVTKSTQDKEHNESKYFYYGNNTSYTDLSEYSSKFNDKLELHLNSTNHTVTSETQTSFNDSDNKNNATSKKFNGDNTYVNNPSYKDKAIADRAKAFPFDCSNRTRGKYADKKDCKKFYICLGTLQPIIGTCPNNTVFSEINKQCTRNLSHCVRNNQFRCLFEGRFSDFFKDNIYYICVKNDMNHFVRYKLQCQNNYHLNKESVKCEKNLDITSQSASVSENTKINNESSSKNKLVENKKNTSSYDFECEKEGRFPHESDCRKYYVCTKSNKNVYRRKIKTCPSEEAYDKKKKKCVETDSIEC